MVTITAYGSGGEGVGRLDNGKVVFVRGAARGDVLEVQLTKELPRSAWAAIVRIITPSAHRITPDCPYYPQCGGCDFRHLTYKEELDAKLKRVNDALMRIGGAAVLADEILSTGHIDGYRNKAVFHADGKSWGFYTAGSHDVISIKKCALLKGDINFALGSFASAELGSEITLRSGRNGLSPPLEEELDGLVFRISGFFQVNTSAALLLYQKVREYASMSSNETLLDLYCGVGSLAIFVGRDAGRVCGVELNAASIKAARDNARRNGFAHMEFVAADAAKWDAHGIAPDCIIVDPPRSGLSRGAVQKILELSPARIVYVSCDPATLARDIRVLLEAYSPTKVCAVDMFPRTANVEAVALLQRNDL
ncbi:MAG: class I SAM-dependent RNA methyltransferase [Oscillospiraceae bacterium]|nr:class I SAM-dependent RNA methyltransferase [Oscillospiraceae bacterium]